jgi:hypothetical protein
MSDDDTPMGAAGPAAGRKTPVRWSAALGARICARVAAGALVYPLCREPGMPTPEGIAKWAKAKPDFAQALDAARRMGGRPPGRRGGVSTYCDETGRAIFERLCDGESLNAIGRDPTMPSLSTLFYWRRRIPEFDEMVAVAKEVQAERLADLGWEMVMGATPETAYLTHVRMTHLRWMTGMMAPRVFRLKPVEPPAPAQAPLRVLLRTFGVETDPATGKQTVVALCPNPDSWEVEREDTPGWQVPPNSQPIPA